MITRASVGQKCIDNLPMLWSVQLQKNRVHSLDGSNGNVKLRKPLDVTLCYIGMMSPVCTMNVPVFHAPKLLHGSVGVGVAHLGLLIFVVIVHLVIPEKCLQGL